MWVLILFASLNPMSQPDSIPGYKTEAQCKKAGKAYEKILAGQFGVLGRSLCIPGPTNPDLTADGP